MWSHPLNIEPLNIEPFYIMAGKKFTIKKKRLRSRAKVRKHKLKVNPNIPTIKPSVEQQNLEVIRSLESKMKAELAK